MERGVRNIDCEPSYFVTDTNVTLPHTETIVSGHWRFVLDKKMWVRIWSDFKVICYPQSVFVSTLLEYFRLFFVMTDDPISYWYDDPLAKDPFLKSGNYFHWILFHFYPSFPTWREQSLIMSNSENCSIFILSIVCRFILLFMSFTNFTLVYIIYFVFYYVYLFIHLCLIRSVFPCLGFVIMDSCFEVCSVPHCFCVYFLVQCLLP